MAGGVLNESLRYSDMDVGDRTDRVRKCILIHTSPYHGRTEHQGGLGKGLSAPKTPLVFGPLMAGTCTFYNPCLSDHPHPYPSTRGVYK